MQRMNLYKFDEEPDIFALNVFHMAVISGVVFAALMLITIINFGVKFKTQLDFNSLQKQEQKIGANIKEAEGKLFTEEERKQLLAEIQRLENEKANIERMMVSLNQLHIDKSTGFSSYMQALSRFSVQGLWLTNFRLSSGGTQVTLEGTTQISENVPKLIQRLGNDPKFMGKKFETFRVYTQNKKPELDENGNEIELEVPEKEIRFIIGSQG